MSTHSPTNGTTDVANDQRLRARCGRAYIARLSRHPASPMGAAKSASIETV
jgi:hypothetical protein